MISERELVEEIVCVKMNLSRTGRGKRAEVYGGKGYWYVHEADVANCTWSEERRS